MLCCSLYVLIANCVSLSRPWQSVNHSENKILIFILWLEWFYISTEKSFKCSIEKLIGNMSMWFMQWIGVNILRPRQNGRYFADDIFRCIFLNENACISLKISLKFVPKVRINNIPALAQIMAWRRQATSHYLSQWWLVYWRIYASLGLNELIRQQAISCTSDNQDLKWRFQISKS